MLDNTLSEKNFPNIRSKPLLVRLEAVSSYSIACHLGKESSIHLTTSSFLVVVGSKYFHVY